MTMTMTSTSTKIRWTRGRIMFTEFLKRNRIFIIFYTLYSLAVVLVLLEVDKQYYQNDKGTIIWEAFGNGEFSRITGLTDAQINAISELALTVRRTRDPQEEAKLKERLMDVLDDPNNIIWRIGIKLEKSSEPRAGKAGAEGRPEYGVNIDYQRKDKIAQINQLSNSLFLRNFTRMASLPLDRGNDGHLLVYYATPRGDPAIQELTTRYRWIALFTVSVLILLALAIARSLLLPLRNATSAIESSTSARTTFIAHPHSRLEMLYNRMALDAVIARLQGQLRDEVTLHPQMTGWEVVSFIVRAFQDQIGIPLVAGLEVVAEGPGRIRATGQRVIGRNEAWPQSEAELAETLEGLLPRDGWTRARHLLSEPMAGRECVVEVTSDPERTGIRYLFALALDGRMQEGAYDSLEHLLDHLTGLVEAGLQALSLRNQLLVQERGRANISLSRNLGHDLTNIIATSKLELMALDRLVGNGQAPEDARRRAILAESLHGLLRSVKFMQETVNLYRAYAFLQHPILETHDGNKLVGETLDLFGMSISAKVGLRRELAEEAPRCVVDPRLIKLALFNLFANALEAIRKTDPDRQANGWIRVVTRRSKEGGLCIAVEDSGTGILNDGGQRAEPHEIEVIFELGHTSRRVGGSQGEGLGLNWVRTIIQDLHGGSILAENIPGGGARFILIFPPLETAPQPEAQAFTANVDY